MSRNFADLSDAELEVFQWVCLGRDTGHRSTVMGALVEKGLIVWTWEGQLARIAVAGEFYGVPLGIHRDWCEWTADEGKRKREPKEPEPPGLDPRAAIGPLPGLEVE